MSNPRLILLVRFKSPLSLEEVIRVAETRIEDFRAVPGLQQKYYMQDPVSCEYAGLYLWESQGALREFQASELRATIAKAYQVEGEPRIELYNVVTTLREG